MARPLKDRTRPIELLEPRFLLAATYGNGGAPWAVIASGISWVEAENYDLGGEGVAYHDTTTANQGGQYRTSEGVDLEGPSANMEGTYRISYANAGEWTTYTLNVAATGTYELHLRAAAAGTGGTARILFGGVDKTGTMTVASTGGWDTFQNIVATVSLSAGTQVMRFEQLSGSFNTDFISLQSADSLTGPQPYGVRGLPVLVPAQGVARAEAEGYDTGGEGVSYHDDTTKQSTATYNGQPFRSSDFVDTGNGGTGVEVNYWGKNDWTQYTVYAQSAGTYELRVNYARGDTGNSTFAISANGTTQIAALSLPTTGDWYGYRDVWSTLNLVAGKNVIRFTSSIGQINYDYFELSSVQTFGNSGSSWPVASSGATRIQAENFDVTPTGYTDTTTGNSGNSTYRATDVDLETTSDTGGGVDVTSIAAGEALEYTIRADLTGYYNLRLRHAGSAGQVRVLLNGVDRTGTLSLPATAGSQTWTTTTAKILFKAGRQVMRVEVVGGGFNLNWLELEKVTSTPVVSVGSGSYASEPPDQALNSVDDLFDRVYDKQYDWINRPAGAPLPTNDWWTNILESPFAGGLWPYPQKLATSNGGVSFTTYPAFATTAGSIGLANGQGLTVTGTTGTFTRDALVNYGDWTVKFRMEQSAGVYMDVTMGRGMPYTWFEFSGITPKLTVGGTFSTYNAAGAALSGTFTADAFRISKSGQEFGIFAPAGTSFTLANGNFTATFSGADKYLVVAALPSAAAFDTFYQHAYAIPRGSVYDWSTNMQQGGVSTTWNITTQLLRTGFATTTIQGWLPHNYRDIISGPSLLAGYEYVSVEGPIKLSIGNSYTIVQPTNGIAFTLPAPAATGGASDYDSAAMAYYLNKYATGDAATPVYGNDTYFGAKALQQFAEFALMAKQLNSSYYATFLNALKVSMTDWMTYTPGETAHYFAMYPDEGAMIGFAPSFGSSNFTDNHFHYGYHTAGAGVLAMLDPTWAAGYGEMAKLVAKQYANWDRTDTRFPFLRTFEPWSGHSYAGGTGDARGNNQESTSEAIQSWLGLALLGQALNDPAMTAAGLMGYTVESKADLEYWFDAPHQDLFPDSYGRSNVAINYDDSKGYGTFFGANPEYILGIEALPLWPSLDFLGRYPTAAANAVSMMLDYRNTFNSSTTMNTWSSFETTAANDWLDINLGYMAQYDPQAAAIEFARMWTQQTPTGKKDQTGLYYYNAYSYRSNGLRNWNLHLSVPLGAIYTNAATGKNTYVAYNSASTAQTIYVYDASGNVVDSFSAAARDTTVKVVTLNSPPTVATPAASNPNPVTGTTANLSVLGADNGGEPNLVYTWSLGSGPAGVAFSRNGNNSAKSSTAMFIMPGVYVLNVTISDGAATVNSSINVTVNSVFTSLQIAPASANLQVSQTKQFAATAFDQFGEIMTTPSIAWSVTGVGSVNSSGLYTATFAGSASVFATSGSISDSAAVQVGSTAPTIVSAASAGQTTVTGLSTTLSVLATDDAGEGALLYNWSVASGPSSVSFSSNGSNASKNSTVTFNQAGTYNLRVTVTDPSGYSTSSSVSVTVQQTAKTLKITPASASIGTNQTKTFLASAQDQFGHTIASPSIAWSIASGAGTVTAGGVFTAPVAAGQSILRATLGALTATSTISTFSWSPYNLAARKLSANTISVSFKDSTTVETGFQIQVGKLQSNGSVLWSTFYSTAASSGSGGSVTYNFASAFAAGTWYFRARATSATGYSNWSNTAMVKV